MEEENIELKPKKQGFIDKIKTIFEDKKKRYLFVFLFCLPFIIAISIFSVIVFKDVKGLVELATGTTEVKKENLVEPMGYVLRDNATDYQKELFAELKSAVEEGTGDDQTIAGLVCENFVADFYTWTNKQGQFDVGGLYYIYDDEYKDGTDFKTNVFLNARTTFYKYLNNYIKDYGQANLLEVNSVTVSNIKKTNCTISEHVANKQDENGDWYDYREDNTYDAYEVTCTWTYKPNEKFDNSSYPTTMNFLVVKKDKFMIVAMNKNKEELNDRKVEEQPTVEENTVEEAD